MNSVGIPEGFRGNAGLSGKSRMGVVSGDLGSQEAFAQMSLGFIEVVGRLPWQIW